MMSSASAWLLVAALGMILTPHGLVGGSTRLVLAGGLGLRGKADAGTAAQKGSGNPPQRWGSLEKEEIQAVIHENRNGIGQCYEAALVNAPKLAGKITVKFTISSQGKVQSVSVVENTMKALALERCVTEHVATWTFPKPKGNGIVQVTYPFSFRTEPDQEPEHGD